MKTYVDRLRVMDIEILKVNIRRQENEEKMIKNDIEIMKRILEQRISNQGHK